MFDLDERTGTFSINDKYYYLHNCCIRGLVLVLPFGIPFFRYSLSIQLLCYSRILFVYY